MIQLPNYLVRKVSGYPGGIRMPKMTKFYQADNYWSNNGFKPMLPQGDGDPLNGGDYRYWCGAFGNHWQKGYANCRCCQELCFTKQERKEHKNKGCGALLEEAYKLFRRSKDCIICTLETNRKVYGLPICCKDCEYEWEYVTACPAALRHVIKQLKDGKDSKK